ncbi:transcription initiation factor Spt5, partial [Reticulomyxa filosa]
KKKKACEGIWGLNFYKVKMVPRNQMVSSLFIPNAAPQVRRGQWCRIEKPATYKGDLGQVYEVLDQGSRVIVRLLPRVDVAKLEAFRPQNSSSNGSGGSNSNSSSSSSSSSNNNNGNNEHHNGRFKNQNFNRPRGYKPPAKLFDKIEIQALGHEVQSLVTFPKANIQCDKFQGKFFKNGYALMSLPVNNVNFDVTASPEEVANLRKKPAKGPLEDDNEDEEEEEDATFRDERDKIVMNAPLPEMPKSCNFTRGDTVRVIKGGLQNMIGKVLSTQRYASEGGKVRVTVMPEHGELTQQVAFDADQLQKYFRLGCHVKVLKGDYKGQTGLIVKLEPELNQVVIFSDLTSQQICVGADEITESSEVSTGGDVFGNYSLYDLVQLADGKVGVIVGINNGIFTVLDNGTKVQTVRLQDITRTVPDKHAVALDIDNMQIRIGDVAIPQLGEFKGTRATVKHIYRGVLWSDSPSCGVNAHIFAIRARVCRLSGSRARTNNASNAMNIFSSKLDGRKDTKNLQDICILNHHNQRKDPWLHKTVQIKNGTFKGYKGIVKGCTDDKLRVELHAKAKIVSVHREQVRVLNADGTAVSEDQDWHAHSGLSGSRFIRTNDRPGKSNHHKGDRPFGNANRHRFASGTETPALIGASTPAYFDGSKEITYQHMFTKKKKKKK